MNDKPTKELVWLTQDELLLLDGEVSLPETQNKIDTIRNARDFGKDKAFILEVIKEGNNKGIIAFRNDYVTCEICNARSEIVNYKGGKRKGQMNWKESKRVRGVSFASDFITFQGRPRLGICDECHTRIIQDLQAELKQNKFDYHAYISDCPYRKDEQRICHSCKRLMYESEMTRMPTIMGQGTYPSGCPHCGMKSLIFGPTHGTTGKWQIIELSQK